MKWNARNIAARTFIAFTKNHCAAAELLICSAGGQLRIHHKWNIICSAAFFLKSFNVLRFTFMWSYKWKNKFFFAFDSFFTCFCAHWKKFSSPAKKEVRLTRLIINFTPIIMRNFHGFFFLTFFSFILLVFSSSFANNCCCVFFSLTVISFEATTNCRVSLLNSNSTMRESRKFYGDGMRLFIFIWVFLFGVQWKIVKVIIIFQNSERLFWSISMKLTKSLKKSAIYVLKFFFFLNFTATLSKCIFNVSHFISTKHMFSS